MTLVSGEHALGHLPGSLRSELLEAFNKIVSNYRARRWEPSELNGGKFSDVVYTILAAHVDGDNYPRRAMKPKNLADSCASLANAAKTYPRSVRLGIPRVLVALYDIRNSRSVGHVGGDVDPNHMDSAVVLAMAKWVLAELVRIFHDVEVTEATQIVEGLTAREIPVVWDSGTVRRVLDPSLSYTAATLLLLYSSPDPLAVNDLLRWTEYGNSSRYREQILGRLHKRRLIEFDRTTNSVTLTTRGSLEVETNLPLHLVGDRWAHTR